LIAVCTDITKIKEVEKQTKVMKSQFFSSVAHELRTPLNSMLPILKLILELFPAGAMTTQKLIELIKIILSSSLHLSGIVEDFLDITRLENNKFTIFKDVFNLRQAIKEVRDIMNLQI
jgi:signal transduction histidine kinase